MSHQTVISDVAKALSARIRGEDAAVAVVPSKTAHVIVDLQNGFMAPGSVAETPMNMEILPNVNKLSVAMRQAGAVNIFLRFTYDAGWTGFYGRFAPGMEEPLKAAFTEGAEQWELHPDLDVDEKDIILDKTRFSALIPGTCDLDAVLKAHGVDTLVVTGCVSNCCCESTIRDAQQMNYKVIFVGDGNAAFSDADHNATVANLYGLFGVDVVSTDDVLERLAQASKQAA